MSPITIPLAHGAPALSQKLQDYFTGVFQAEDSGREFPVTLEHVWRIAYPRKDHALRALRKKFAQGIDYQVLLISGENYINGRPTEEYFLTVSCLEYFVVRANREVFDVYRACRKAVRTLLNPSAPVPTLPTSYKQALQALLGEVERNEVLETELTAARPKVLFFDNVATAVNAVPIAVAAKVLKLPGIGRNKLFELLRNDHVLQQDNTPYQSQIDQGHFELALTTYAMPSGGEKIVTSARATGKGLAWMAQRYRNAA